MRWQHHWARHRVVSLWVALSLVGVAAAMVLFAIVDQQVVAFVDSLTFPGRPAPNTSWFDGGGMARAEAVIAGVLGAAVITFPNRALFVISAACSLLALATGTSTLVGYPRWPIDVGPIVLSTSSVGIGLALMAVSCVAGCLVGWFVSPPESKRKISFMPPPTHQG